MPTDNNEKTDLSLSEKIHNLIIDQLKNTKALTESEMKEIKLEDEYCYISNAYSFIIKNPGLEKHIIEDLLNKDRSFRKELRNTIPGFKDPVVVMDFSVQAVPHSPGEFKITLYEKINKRELLKRLFLEIMMKAEASDYKALDQSSLEEFKSNPQVPYRNYIDSGYELIVQDDRLKNKFSENAFNQKTINSIFNDVLNIEYSSNNAPRWRSHKKICGKTFQYNLLEHLKQNNKLKELHKIDKLANMYVKIINKDEGKITINLFHTKTKKKEKIASIIQKNLLDNGPIDKCKLEKVKRDPHKEYQVPFDLDPNFKKGEYHIAHELLMSSQYFNEYHFNKILLLKYFIEELLNKKCFKNFLIKKPNEERKKFGLDLLSLDKTTKIGVKIKSIFSLNLYTTL